MGESRVLCFYLSEKGKKVAEGCGIFLSAYFGQTEVKPFAKEFVCTSWPKVDLLVFVMALSIVVRTIAPLLKEKGKDPGVLVVDELGRQVIPLIGGHARKTNQIAKDLALFLSAQPVITTASDLNGVLPLDIWLKDQRLLVKNKGNLAQLMAKINKWGEITVFLEEELKIPLPTHLKRVEDISSADLIITYRLLPEEERFLSEGKVKALPQVLWIGLGFHEVLTEGDFEKIITNFLTERGFDPLSLEGIATLKQKAKYLPLKNFCLNRGYKLRGFKAEELAQIKTDAPSQIVLDRIGTGSVAIASAILGSKGKLLIPKIKGKDYTLALAVREVKPSGKIFILGLGPGDYKYLTIRALQVMNEAQAFVGYETYLRQIQPFLAGKEVNSYRMTEEIKRAKKTVELALEGKKVALVSGGDPGIYGMAVLVLEVVAKSGVEVEVEIIPGISALNAGASLCGAPLANDFAVISLSDRLTPLEVIEKRLRHFAQADVPIVLFNPRSKGRIKPLQKALEILLEERGPETPLALLNNIGRSEEEVIFTKLSDLPLERLGMNSTLLVGSSQTKFLDLWMITHRGYEQKYNL